LLYGSLIFQHREWRRRKVPA